MSRRQVERLVSRAVAVFGLIFAAQTVPVMISQLWEVAPVWAAVFVPLLYATLVVALVASIAQRIVRQAQAAVAIVYLVGILSWPFAIVVVESGAHATYWLYYLLSVATAMAAIAFSPRLAIAYLLLVPAVMAVVRVASGAVSTMTGVLDSVYAVILGGVIIVIITMLRQAASAVDSAQAAALDTYGLAVRQHATEVERAQVDAIVHDSVLTTLLSAARAESPEAKALAATMAANAIGHLRQAALVGPRDETSTSVAGLASRITEAAGSLGAVFELRVRVAPERLIAAPAAEAVYSAAVQAMVNSVQHAGGAGTVRRWLSIRGMNPTGVEVEIGDTGSGFHAWSVPQERLGVRVSILERLHNAGGTAEVDSEPGEGTIVTLRWPAGVRS